MLFLLVWMIDCWYSESLESWVLSCKSHKSPLEPLFVGEHWGLLGGLDLEDVLVDEGSDVSGCVQCGVGGSWWICSWSVTGHKVTKVFGHMFVHHFYMAVALWMLRCCSWFLTPIGFHKLSMMSLQNDFSVLTWCCSLVSCQVVQTSICLAISFSMFGE
jgi:hypothetical protein